MTTGLALIQGSDTAAPSLPGGVGSTPTSVGKANLTLHEPNTSGGSGQPLGDPLNTIEFHFNPKELSFSKSAKWTRPAAKDATSSATPEYQGAEPTKLTLEMFLDVSRSKTSSVVDTVELLLTCCVPTEKSKADSAPRPPVVIFHWGKIQSVPLLVSQVSVKYTRFSPEGAPIRATCNVSMEEIPAEPGPTNPSSGATGARGQHLFLAGDSLASLAYREYQDPGMWRAIADANGIDDPLRVRIGATLLLPRADELQQVRA